ncbi:MAG: hypothetical protein ACW991_06225 [Candidatus Hodarchaeales archaeon]|jgi:hypothetical protein
MFGSFDYKNDTKSVSHLFGLFGGIFFTRLDEYFFKIQGRSLSEGLHCLLIKKDVNIVGWKIRRGTNPMAISAPLSV